MNTRKTLNESDLKQFENFDKLSKEYFIISLGIGLQYEFSPSGIKYSAPYEKMGQRLWIAFRYELLNSLCDVETKEPKEWLNDIVT